MTWLLALALPAGWLTVQVTTGGWRRLLVRVAWRSIARSVGAAVRRDRVSTRKPGPGEHVSRMTAVEHLPVLFGLWGRPVGPVTARMGARWRVLAANGQTTAELATLAERFAAAAWCRRAIVDIKSPRTCELTLLWRDPFATVRPWYPAEHGRLRPAFDVRGQPVDVPVIDQWGGSWLIGAASGSGKSAWLNAIVADLARQPVGTVHLLGVDLKRVELGPWSPAFVRVARTADEADRLFSWARTHIDRRMADLEANGLRHVPDRPTVRWPYVVLVVDELGALMSGRDTALDRRRALLGELAMLGRAAGVLLVCAVQRPTTDLVPGQLRDNLGRRVLLRVATIDQGRAVLGWMPDQATVDQLDTPGLALVDLPGRQPFLARSTYCEVEHVTHLARTHARKEPAHV